MSRSTNKTLHFTEVNENVEFVLVPNEFWGMRVLNLSERYLTKTHDDCTTSIECACFTGNLPNLGHNLGKITQKFEYEHIVITSFCVVNRPSTTRKFRKLIKILGYC